MSNRAQFIAGLMLLAAALPLSAQSSDVVTVSFSPGGPSTNGYASALVPVKYHFQYCSGDVWIVTGFDRESIATSRTYWLDGREYSVPAEVDAPGEFLKVELYAPVHRRLPNGGAVAIGTADVGVFGIYQGGCFNAQNFQTIVKAKDVLGENSTIEQREQLSESLFIPAGSTRRMGPLINPSVESAVRAQIAEAERQRVAEQERQAAAQREATQRKVSEAAERDRAVAEAVRATAAAAEARRQSDEQTLAAVTDVVRLSSDLVGSIVNDRRAKRERTERREAAERERLESAYDAYRNEFMRQVRANAAGYLPKAEQGDAESQYRVCDQYSQAMIRFGINSPEGRAARPLAVYWCELAVDQKHQMAVVWLYSNLSGGYLGYEKNSTKAKNVILDALTDPLPNAHDRGWYDLLGRIANGQERVAWYRHYLAVAPETETEDIKHARQEIATVEEETVILSRAAKFEPAASRGDADAQFQLCWVYWSQSYTEANQEKYYPKAFEWCSAASKKRKESLVIMGFVRADQPIPNAGEAVRLFKRADKSDISDNWRTQAYIYLGDLYSRGGRDVDVDYKEAQRWYEKAIAAAGDVPELASFAQRARQRIAIIR